MPARIRRRCITVDILGRLGNEIAEFLNQLMHRETRMRRDVLTLFGAADDALDRFLRLNVKPHAGDGKGHREGQSRLKV